MDALSRSARNNFTNYHLDRTHHDLQNEAWVAQQLTHPSTGFLPVWALQHLITPGSHPRPVILTQETATPLLSQAESVTLLGVAHGRMYVVLDLPATEKPPAALATWLSVCGLPEDTLKTPRAPRSSAAAMARATSPT